MMVWKKATHFSNVVLIIVGLYLIDFVQGGNTTDSTETPKEVEEHGEVWIIYYLIFLLILHVMKMKMKMKIALY